MRFDISDLRVFRAVAATASMTKAATEVHLTVASVSERIKQMEAQIGVPLLSRSASGVIPTEAGRALLHHAFKVLRQFDIMNEDLANVVRRSRSRVRLHATSYAVAELLQQHVPNFMRVHQDIELVIEESHSEEVASAVRNGAADIGIVGDFVDLRSLEAMPLLHDRLVAVVGEHAGRHLGDAVTFGELLRYDFIGLGQGSELQQFLQARARDLGEVIRLRVRARNLAAICSLAADGIGFAIVPYRTAGRFMKAGSRLIGLVDQWAVYNTVVIAREASDLTPAAWALRAGLVDYGAESAQAVR